MKSPFKFLDSFTKEDKNIFFGRDNETEELYQKVFESKVLLVYGVSGTGKSSLVHCGLANKFQESDWLPINIRRGANINKSLLKSIANCQLQITNNDETVIANEVRQSADNKQIATSASGGLAMTTKKKPSLKKQLKNLYLDHFKPIYLIFDQFEELFIFGSKSEREDFIQTVKTITESDINCKFMFVIREEYLAGITEFEKHLPEIMHNRIRLEKMTRNNAVHVIDGPCKVAEIEVEEGFSEALLNKLSPDSTEVELTYLQVYLDKLFKQSPNAFTISLLQSFGDVKDLLGSFLDEQIAELDTPDEGLVILKAFVSTKGTKRQITEEEVQDYARTLGKNIDISQLKNLIQKFIALRILRDKDENNRYELRHDALAAKIYEKITLVEKELLEIRQFIENAYDNYRRRKILLSKTDLSYIAPYEDKIYLGNNLNEFLNKSKREVEKKKRRKRVVVSIAAIVLLAVFATFTWWALNERNKAVDSEKIAIIEKNKAIRAIEEANIAKAEASEAKQEADSLKKMKTVVPTLVVSATKMNVFYIGVDNPISFAVAGVPNDKIFPSISGCGGRIKKTNRGYIVTCTKPGNDCRISVAGDVNGTRKNMGGMNFRVKRVPDPTAKVAGKGGGKISKEELLENGKIDALIDNFDFDIRFKVVEFQLIAYIGGFSQSVICKGSKFNDVAFNIIKKAKRGQFIYLGNIKAVGPDGKIRPINGIIFKLI